MHWKHSPTRRDSKTWAMSIRESDRSRLRWIHEGTSLRESNGPRPRGPATPRRLGAPYRFARYRLTRAPRFRESAFKPPAAAALGRTMATAHRIPSRRRGAAICVVRAPWLKGWSPGGLGLVVEQRLFQAGRSCGNLLANAKGRSKRCRDAVTPPCTSYTVKRSFSLPSFIKK